MNTLIVIDKRDLSEQIAISLYNHLGSSTANVLGLSVALTQEVEERAILASMPPIDTNAGLKHIFDRIYGK